MIHMNINNTVLHNTHSKQIQIYLETNKIECIFEFETQALIFNVTMSPMIHMESLNNRSRTIKVIFDSYF